MRSTATPMRLSPLVAKKLSRTWCRAVPLKQMTPAARTIVVIAGNCRLLFFTIIIATNN